MTNTLEISIHISYTNTMLCLAVYFATHVCTIYISVLLVSIFGICMYTCVISDLSCIVLLRLY